MNREPYSIEIKEEDLIKMIEGQGYTVSKWIPCNKKLPLEYETVLVTGKMKYAFEKEYEYFVDCAFVGRLHGTPDNFSPFDFETWDDWYEGQEEYHILAWQPLPKSYKEEGDLISRQAAKAEQNIPDPEKLQVFFDKDFSKSLDALRESFVKSIDIINQALRQQFKDAGIIRNVTTPESAKIVLGKMFYSNRLSYPEQKAMTFAMKGIEKMIQSKMIYESDSYADGSLVWDMARCPNCNCEFDDTYDGWQTDKYCPRCGQALDWEMEAEDDEGYKD